MTLPPLLKRLAKRIGWLYSLCLMLCSILRILRRTSSKMRGTIKRFILNHPWLHKICVGLYRLLRWIRSTVSQRVQQIRNIPKTFKILRGTIREKSAHYPHLYIYMCHCRDIAKGKVAAGLGGIAKQAVRDVRNWRQLRKSAEELHRLYAEAILCCIEHRVHKWWKFLPSAKFDSIPALQSILRECVFRRAGDYQTFLRLREETASIFGDPVAADEFYDKMAKYYASAIADMDAGLLTKDAGLDPARRNFIIGFSVWGERYLAMLLDYCLPSLLAEGNLGTLCKERQVVILIHTNPETRILIENTEVARRIKELGACIIYKMISETLVAHFDDNTDYKYWHLGMVQSIDLYLAKTLAADYHLLMPDTIYSNRHFEGILRAAARGHKVIPRLAISTRMEGICLEMAHYRENGAISVPIEDLAALSMKHLHSASKAWAMTNKNLETELSNIHVVIWEGKDTLHMFSPHNTIMYVDREIMSQIPKRYFFTLDSELDKIIPKDCPIYAPQPEDGIGILEATSEKQRAAEPPRKSLQEFCATFWHSTQESMEYWKFFSASTIDPINRALLPEREHMDDAEIRYAKHTVLSALLDSYPDTIPEKEVQLVQDTLRMIKMYPKAKGLKNAIDDISAFVLENTAKKPHLLLEQLYHEAILCCIKNKVHKWWSFLPDASFSCATTLDSFLRECVLRRAGDYREFLRLRKSLKTLHNTSPYQQDFYDQLARHYALAAEEIDTGLLTRNVRLDSDHRPFVIAFSVWGNHYIGALLEYCLPSLLANGNLPALSRARQAVLFIHTNPAGRQVIEAAEITQRIKKLGVVIVYRILDAALTSRFEEDGGHKYWHLGMVQSLDLHFAKAINADYHLLVPDTIYSDHHFEGILKAASRGHKVVVRLGLSTRSEGICPEMEAYRRNGIISVPAADLTALSVKHTHSASQGWIITRNDLTTELPSMYMVVMEGKNSVHTLSPHMTVLYVDREVVRNIPDRFYLTLDGELDKIIPADCPIYHPQAQDEISLVEITSERQRPTPIVKNPPKEFARLFWYSAQESMSYWRFFEHEIVDPLNRALLPEQPYMSDAEIAHAKQFVKALLLDAYPPVCEEQLNRALEILEALKKRPQSEEAKESIEKEIYSIRFKSL